METHEIRGRPMVLRAKAPGQVWTVRIKLPATGKDFGRIERSTRERDLDRAIEAAHRIYEEVTRRLQSRGDASRPRTFAEVAQEFIDLEAVQCSAGRITRTRLERDKITLRRHFVPSLGNIPIDQLRTFQPQPIADDAPAHEARDLEDYLNKRLSNEHRPAGDDEITFRRYGKTHTYKRPAARPSPETLRRERQAFYAVMNFARERRYVLAEEILQIPIEVGQVFRREAGQRSDLKPATILN